MYLCGVPIHTATGVANRMCIASVIIDGLGEFGEWHDYTIGKLDVLQACDACADMGMTYSVIVQCTDCVVFPGEFFSRVSGSHN